MIASAAGDAEFLAHAGEFSPELREPAWRPRNDPGPPTSPAGDGRFDVLKADGTDGALGLGENEVGLERTQLCFIHVVERQGLLRQRFDIAINFGGGGVGIDFRCGADGEPPDRFREVALV